MVNHLEWRSTAEYGRVLDFIAGDLVLQVGRPVLIVPPDARELLLKNVLIGWNDTRESRRAIADALPVLKQAANVTIATITDEEDLVIARSRVADVAHWLEQHGVVVEQQIASACVGEDADGLCALARDMGADLVVAGAYGHSRLREWILGGVTKDLLLSNDRYSLLSH